MSGVVRETGAAPSATAIDIDAGPAAADRLVVPLICALGFLMITFDATAVNIILPHVQAALGLAESDRQWTMTAFSLVFGASLAIGGRVVDRIGPSRALPIGALGFGAFSTLAGLAQSPTMLIVSRGLQALAGSLLGPATLALLNQTAGTETRLRARSFALYGAVSAAGGPLGMILAGVLTQTFSWRLALAANGVLGLLVTGLAVATLKRRAPIRRDQGFDVIGAVLVTLGLAGLLLGLSRLGGPTAGQPVLGCTPVAWCLIGVVALVALIFVERRQRDPIVPLSLFTERRRGSALLCLALIAGSFMGVAVLMSFYVQDVLHYAPAVAGLALLPSTIGSLIGPAATGYLVPKIGAKRTWLLGGAGLLAGGAILATVQPESSYWLVILPGDFLAGLGLGFSLMPAASILLYQVPREMNGAAGALNNATVQISAASAATLFNTIFVLFAASGIGATGIGGYNAAFLAECVAAGLAMAIIAVRIVDLPRDAAGDPVPVTVH